MPDNGVGQPLSLTELCALLGGEPWHLRPWEVGKLTPYQVSNIYFHERDEHGNLKRKPVGSKTYQERFFLTWQRRGLPQWRIEELWEQWEAKQEKRCGR